RRAAAATPAVASQKAVAISLRIAWRGSEFWYSKVLFPLLFRW
ncbi:529_t:CDS:1, partial [Scutellospora calospora]